MTGQYAPPAQTAQPVLLSWTPRNCWLFHHSIILLLHHLRAELQIQWFTLFHYGIRLQTCNWSVSKSNDFRVYVATGAEMQRNINRGNKSSQQNWTGITL